MLWSTGVINIAFEVSTFGVPRFILWSTNIRPLEYQKGRFFDLWSTIFRPLEYLKSCKSMICKALLSRKKRILNLLNKSVKF
jgi:hypothetical protein